MDQETLNRIDKMEDRILQTVNTRIDDVKEFTKDMVVMSGQLNRNKLMGEIVLLRDDMEALKDCPNRVTKLEKETVHARWLYNKPGRAISLVIGFFIAVVLASALLAPRIDPKDTIENVTPFEFDDETE